MHKPNTAGHRADSGEELTPEEMEAAIALFMAQKAAGQATAGADSSKVPPAEGEEPAIEKSPVEKVRDNMDRRDSDGGNMASEDVIAEQKADLEALLAEIDKLQASSDMNGDAAKEPPTEPKEPSAKPTGEESATGAVEGEKEKGVNMDSVDRIVQDRLDICRMADKLHLDGVEKMSVREGRMAIIKAVNPKMNLDGKSDGYINAAYDIAKDSFQERKTTDDQRKSMMDAKVRQDAKEESNSNSARKNMIARMTGGKK